jgi:predicted RNase H-like HicB family nuclease
MIISGEQYIRGCMREALYEHIPRRKNWYGSIPGLPGLWAQGKTRNECRTALRSALRGWLIVNKAVGKLPLPSLRNGVFGHAHVLK